MANDIRPLGAISPTPLVKEQYRDKMYYVRQQKQQKEKHEEQKKHLPEQSTEQVEVLHNDEQASEQTEQLAQNSIDRKEKNVKVEHIDEYV